MFFFVCVDICLICMISNQSYEALDWKGAMDVIINVWHTFYFPPFSTEVLDFYYVIWFGFILILISPTLEMTSEIQMLISIYISKCNDVGR